MVRENLSNPPAKAENPESANYLGTLIRNLHWGGGFEGIRAEHLDEIFHLAFTSDNLSDFDASERADLLNSYLVIKEFLTKSEKWLEDQPKSDPELPKGEGILVHIVHI